MIWYKEFLHDVSNRFRYIRFFRNLYRNRVLQFICRVDDDMILLKTSVYFDGDMQCMVDQNALETLTCAQQKMLIQQHFMAVRAELDSIIYLRRHVNTLMFLLGTSLPLLFDFESAIKQFVAFFIAIVMGFFLRQLMVRAVWQLIRWFIRMVQGLITT